MRAGAVVVPFARAAADGGEVGGACWGAGDVVGTVYGCKGGEPRSGEWRRRAATGGVWPIGVCNGCLCIFCGGCSPVARAMATDRRDREDRHRPPRPSRLARRRDQLTAIRRSARRRPPRMGATRRRRGPAALGAYLAHSEPCRGRPQSSRWVVGGSLPRSRCGGVGERAKAAGGAGARAGPCFASGHPRSPARCGEAVGAESGAPACR